MHWRARHPLDPGRTSRRQQPAYRSNFRKCQGSAAVNNSIWRWYFWPGVGWDAADGGSRSSYDAKLAAPARSGGGTQALPSYAGRRCMPTPSYAPGGGRWGSVLHAEDSLQLGITHGSAFRWPRPMTSGGNLAAGDDGPWRPCHICWSPADRALRGGGFLSWRGQAARWVRAFLRSAGEIRISIPQRSAARAATLRLPRH